VTFLDTSDMYGSGHNEELVGRAIAGRRDEVQLATKFAVRREGGERRVDNSPEWIRQACEDSLRRLNVERIDLYYMHRRNPQVPIEESVGAMAARPRRADRRGRDRGRGRHPAKRVLPALPARERERNLELVERAREIAAEVRCTPAQLALAWLLHQGDDVVPIPGTRRVSRLDENAAAVDVKLSEDQLRRLAETFAPGVTAGDRYTPEGMASVEL
jgi:aryl-alcohol dehydrogenase-like predicted oxidoreductase